MSCERRELFSCPSLEDVQVPISRPRDDKPDKRRNEKETSKPRRSVGPTPNFRFVML